MANSNGNSNGKVIEPEHLNYFSISNFKRFDFIELKDLGQFNLIVGDNNIGKTSILEALSLLGGKPKITQNPHYHLDTFLTNLEFGLSNRGFNIQRLLNFEKTSFQNSASLKDFLSSDKIIEIDTTFSKGDNLAFKITVNNDFAELVYLSKKSSSIKRSLEPDSFNDYFNDLTPIISSHSSYESSLIDLFFHHFKGNRARKKMLADNLKVLINNIEDIDDLEIGGTKYFGIYIKDKDEVIPINQFGEGAVRLVRIIMELLKYSGQRLMIDEITSGIHHSRLVDFWRVVIQSCVNNQVQLFATTHSNESLESFQKALELEELAAYQEKARVIRMSKMNDNSVKAYTMKFESFQTMLENGNEIRGWA